MPVWRKTRCRILRIAAESSTIRTSESIGLLTQDLSVVSRKSLGRNEKTEFRIQDLACSVDRLKNPTVPPMIVPGGWIEPAAFAAGDRCRFSEHAGSPARDAGDQVRFPTSGPHPQVAGTRHPSVA